MRLVTAADRVSLRESFARQYENAQVVAHEHLSDGSDVTLYRQLNVTSGAMVYFLVGFAGTAGKPAMHYSYRKEESARAYFASFLESRRHSADLKATGRAARKAFVHTLQVGTVLASSWGYDQTNIDYYQVVRLAGRQNVVIRAIAAREHTGNGDPWMTGSCWPLADSFTGPETLHRVGEGNSVKVRKWGVWARPWDGKLDRWTAYA